MFVLLIFAVIFGSTFSNNSLVTKENVCYTSTSDFSIIVQTSAFVDKTLAIKEFMEGFEFIMITTPRRFGKSTNMNMIKTFLEVTVDEKGNKLQTNETSNYALFTRNNLNIYKYYREFFENHFGKYPIIYLDFKELTCESYDDFLNSIRQMLWLLFQHHKYLLESNILDKDNKNDYNMFCTKRRLSNLSIPDLLTSVRLLSNLLYTHFNKTKCIVLIDEYDAPIQEYIFHGGSGKEKIFHFIQKFISILLKSNPFVERALITACVRLSGILTSSANNIIHYPFTETHGFNEYYGLTEPEVIRLVKEHGVQDSFTRIRKWYYGYRLRDGKLKIYNVFSIVNYFASKQFENYWAQPDYFLNLEKLCLYDEIYNKIMSLLMNKTIEIEAIDKISIAHVIYLRNLVTTPEKVKVDKEGANLFLNFMLDLGYFTILETSFIRENEVIYKLTIPNGEIRREIWKRLHNLEMLSDKFNVSHSDIHSYVQSILNLGNENSSYEEFGKAVLKLFKGKGFPKNERQLQNPLVAFPWYYGKRFVKVESEYKTGKRKYIDFLIIRKDSTGIIIELKNKKRSAKANTGQTPYNAALDQIVNPEHTYYDIFNSTKLKKVRHMILIGLYLDIEGNCGLSYLYNNTDISKAVDISIL